MIEYLSSLPNALALGIIWGLMAIGIYITYKILDIPDLTVDGSFATGGAICAITMVQMNNWGLSLLFSFLIGLACGLVTGLLHTLLGIPAILAGILTQLTLWSINLKILDGANISVNATQYHTLLSLFDIPNALWKLGIIIALIIGFLYLFFGTELGCAIRATGNNPKMSNAQGINTKRNIVIGLSISNGLVALAGALFAQYQGFADIKMGSGAIVIGLCSIVIGSIIFSKIARNFAVRLISVVFGAIIYSIIYQTAVFFDLDTDLLKMLAALIVAIFLGVPYLRRTYGLKFKKWKENRKMRLKDGK